MRPPTGGIVRPARRPPGWRVPGPPPRTPADRPELWPGPGEDLCFLAGDWRILQRVDGHRWSVDDLCTAWWAARSVDAPPARHVDLGCGIGTVLLLLAWRFPSLEGLGLEAQAVSVGLARRSIAWNGVEARCRVREADFRDPAATAGLGPQDLVTGTPPYLPPGTGSESARVQCGPCRFEHRGGVEDYVRVAAGLLGPGAPFVGCAAARQRERVRAAADETGLVVESWREVVPRRGKPSLFAVFALRRASAATATREPPPLVVRDVDGRRTSEFRALRAEMGLP
ncbi:MAG: methyltransferase [Deltaproteobacteria bacterium]|nr:methyltransferase [Deltaproteobacteria bacterium]